MSSSNSLSLFVRHTELAKATPSSSVFPRCPQNITATTGIRNWNSIVNTCKWSPQKIPIYQYDADVILICFTTLIVERSLIDNEKHKYQRPCQTKKFLQFWQVTTWETFLTTSPRFYMFRLFLHLHISEAVFPVLLN